ncbi:hypothetical protein [Agrobacterium burrii]|uniref:Uncharacterized protein n=1 Tax=Agrobacterium burrii TaxID=2815339 RepID=A0ABS3EAY6_9HYPH|nr:hypothetical protein [Agrobacterium burrii]MBO0129134.1 hypothetical protein [Agrobacterium burrii]
MGEFKKGDVIRAKRDINSFFDKGAHYRIAKKIGQNFVLTDNDEPEIEHAKHHTDLSWLIENFELVTLKIEAGKFYKTRDGRKAKIERLHYSDSYDFVATVEGLPGNKVYKKDGKHGSWWIANNPSDDIIAEWIDEPVAKPSNDNAKPKFKVGDRVEITANDNYRVSFVGSFGTVKAVPAKAAAGFRVELDDGREFPFWPSEMTARPSSAPKPTTTIVALIENGQPKPSSTPHVHTSTDSAEKEAKRLAAKYKGKQFGVFTLTTTHEEAATVYDHKWQNMAALGLKIDAIKELRAVAGLDLLSAKRAVEAFDAAA